MTKRSLSGRAILSRKIRNKEDREQVLEIIDFHTHTFPDHIAAKAIGRLSRASHTVPFSDGTDAGLLVRMDESGTDLSVILPVATSPKQVERINDTAAEVNGRYPRLHSFGGIHPDYEGWKGELARIRDLGLKGIKIHPVYQDTDLDDIRFLRILDRCAELGLIVTAHAGLDIGFPGIVRCSPKMAAHALAEVPGVTLVLAHMGGWRNWDEVTELLPGTGAFIDTAFSGGAFTPLDDGYWRAEDTGMLSPVEFVGIVRAFGADRVLFGTDSPWSAQAEELAFVRGLPLTDEEKERILGGNARKLLGL